MKLCLYRIESGKGILYHLSGKSNEIKSCGSGRIDKKLPMVEFISPFVIIKKGIVIYGIHVCWVKNWLIEINWRTKVSKYFLLAKSISLQANIISRLIKVYELAF